ncbi:TPR repeat-containing protein [Sphaceloma murrayae]|uniref:TPR repeat-containing protein n=1 Tax=Sphaceloma murrayae TaxID=2082308 RepID=A0A2K1QVK7_9PEZI|nr:TPR repeat-containing protein [Sphaceloma murrayae]
MPLTRSVIQNLKILFMHYPYAVSLAAFFIVLGVVILGYFNYYYIKYFHGSLHNYPESVAKQLRRALYHTNIDLQPQKAFEYYQKAMDKAREEGMDPYSDEVLGIKLQLAYLMEVSNNIPNAIRILETIRADCIARSIEALSEPSLSPSKQQIRRTRLLYKAVAISLKLSEYYANPYIRSDAAALETLLWAVNTVLRENAARQSANATDDSHGPWLSSDEFGAILESLAHQYEKDNNHFLAAPLFLQALAAKEKTDCHSVVLMNNLSISLAQQDPPSEPGIPPPSREALVQSAREWAEKAIRVAGKVEERDEECDVGCAVAMHNLGEFEEMVGRRKEAAERYREAVGVARGVGFAEGVKRSTEALKRLGEGQAIRNS